MKLRDKATTLKHLKIKSANIPKIISFEVDKYKKNKNFRLIGMGGSSLGTQAIHDFLREKIKKILG